MPKIKTPVCISKYALSAGLIHTTGIVADGRVSNITGFEPWESFALGKDAFLTEAEARKNAKERCARKIKSLEKQIATLKNFKF